MRDSYFDTLANTFPVNNLLYIIITIITHSNLQNITILKYEKQLKSINRKSNKW